MSVEVNSELGLKFSSASLPSVKFPDLPMSLVYVNAASGSVVLLDGFNYLAERLNRAAIAGLAAGLDNGFDNQKLGQIAEGMRDLFIKTSAEVAREAKGVGGINATATKLVEAAPDVDVFCFGHIGRNRIYKLNPLGGYDLLTIDAGYSYERHLVTFSAEDRGIIWYLDDMDKKEDLNLVERSPRASALWSYMLVPPAEHLGSENPNIQYGWNSFLRGERLFLSSVGLHRSLTRREIVDILKQEDDPAAVLAEAARERSSRPHYFRAAPYNDYAAIVVEKI